MNRSLQYLNLVGVLALAVLCGMQWRANSRLNREATNLERTEQDQSAQLAENAKTLHADAAALDGLRKALAESNEAIKATEAKLLAETTVRNRIAGERDQLVKQVAQTKAALDKWVAAVSERDNALKRAGEEIEKLADDRNQAITKLNDLATRYNAMIKNQR